MYASQLPDADWNLLVTRIETGRCTPFLGAGAAAELLPLGGQVAKELAEDHNYPFENQKTDLVKVSQYVAIRYDTIYVKECIANKLKKAHLPDRNSDVYEPHRVLAKLPLPLYITTNYDDLMTQALRGERKEPREDYCRWHESLQASPSRKPPIPTIANPLVFHLHGKIDVVDSIVVTEDDYLDYLTTSKRRELLPTTVQNALTSNSLLFIGYQLADWNFRVILRSLPRLSINSYLVMREPHSSEELKKQCQAYLAKYYDRLNIKIYWGTAREFLSELLHQAGARFN